MINFQKLQAIIDEISQLVEGLLSNAYGAFEDEAIVEDVQSIEHSLKEFKTRYAKAVEADMLTLSGMAHDLRGPFNSIIGYPEMLLEDDITPEQASAIQTIYDRACFLIGQMNNILDYARLQTSTLKTDDNIQFNLVDELNNQQGLYLQDRPVNLQVIGDVPQACGDVYQIRRSYFNLLENAMIFSEEEPIDVTVKSVNGLIEISIKDRGTGIKAEHIAHIFEPFWCAAQDTSRLGLGLYLAKQFTQRNNGTIRVESTPGEGSTFTMTVAT